MDNDVYKISWKSRDGEINEKHAMYIIIPRTCSSLRIAYCMIVIFLNFIDVLYSLYEVKSLLIYINYFYYL